MQTDIVVDKAASGFLPRSPRIFLHVLCAVTRPDPADMHPPTENALLLVLSLTGGIIGIPRGQVETYAPGDRLTLHIRANGSALQLPTEVVRHGKEEPLWGLHLPVRFVDVSPAIRKRLLAFLNSQAKSGSAQHPSASTSRRRMRKARRRIRLYCLTGGLGLLCLLALHSLSLFLHSLFGAPQSPNLTPSPSPVPAHAHPVWPTDDVSGSTPDGASIFVTDRPVLKEGAEGMGQALRGISPESLTPEQRIWLLDHFSTEELLQLHEQYGGTQGNDPR